MTDKPFFRTPALPGELIAGTIAVAAGLTFTADEADEFEASIGRVEALETIEETVLNSISLR